METGIDKVKSRIKELVPNVKDYGLADVLLAIGTNTHPKPKLELWSVQLEMYMIDDDGNNLLWDLTKPYDDQSQETKDFIGNILQANK